MLYMCSLTGNEMLKVGYAKDFKTRERAYWTACGPAFQLIDIIEGDETDEKNFQLTLESLGFIPCSDERFTEWYYIPSGLSKKIVLELGFNLFKNLK